MEEKTLRTSNPTSGTVATLINKKEKKRERIIPAPVLPEEGSSWLPVAARDPGSREAGAKPICLRSRRSLDT